MRRGQRIWLRFRPLLVALLSVSIVLVFIVSAYNIVLRHFFQPVDPNDDTPIVVEIESGLGKSGIAKALYGESETDRVINSPTMFKIYVDFMGKASRLRAGSYELNKTMTVPEIVNKLASGDGSIQTIQQFTIIEGSSVEDMANQLEAAGVLHNKADFLALCKSGAGFESVTSYQEEQGERRYVLEGYLFPDTYKVYEGTQNSAIIQLLVNRFNEMISSDDLERAEELDMTMDEVITMASIVEKEAKRADFAKVAAVFYNRLQADMPLESDVTVKYVLGVSQINLTREQLNTETPYNTHLNKGLPPGPICNPGIEAIRAVLWPDEEYIAENSLYFALKDPGQGELGFSKTYEEHQALVEQYQDLWRAYDEQAASQASTAASVS